MTSQEARLRPPHRGARSFGRTWIEVSVITSPEAAEAVGAMMMDLRGGGLVESRPSSSRVRLRCYLAPSRVLPVTLRTLRARVRSLARFGLDPRPGLVTHRRVASRRWATAWRAWVRPVQVGRLLVLPSWVRAPSSPGRTVIQIDPGMAFGTGMHPSTRLCLRALLRYLPAPREAVSPIVVDVGTGSGILAIAAARLGAARVRAVDTDPVAVEVARANVRQNDVERRVRVVQGDGLGGVSGRVDVIVANIIAEAVIRLLPAVRRRLAPGGIFVGSGIITSRLPEVQRAARRADLQQVEVLTQGEWWAVVLSRQAAPAVLTTSARRPRRWRGRRRTRRPRGR